MKSELTEEVTDLVDLIEKIKEAEEVNLVTEVEEVEWDEGEVEVVAEVAIDGMTDMKLMMTGPYDPSTVIHRDLYVEFMVYDR